MSGGYRAPMNAGPLPPQQNYGNNYGGGNALHHPSAQQQYYGQPPPQIYHQPMPNSYQQMGQIPRQMNPPQPLDTRGYVQPPQQQMPMQNRS
jgi:hypothetical protein